MKCKTCGHFESEHKEVDRYVTTNHKKQYVKTVHRCEGQIRVVSDGSYRLDPCKCNTFTKPSLEERIADLEDLEERIRQLELKIEHKADTWDIP